MMLPYSFHDEAAMADVLTEGPTNSHPNQASKGRTNRDLHLIAEKIKVPSVPGLVERSRISDFLLRSASSFAASLISGRAGTGKTYAAVDLARHYKKVAWYSIEPSDADWGVFSTYLSAAVGGKTGRLAAAEATDTAIVTFLTKLFAPSAKASAGTARLIVLDDLHHLFDAEWFPSFFNQLLASVPQNSHLLLLCRSRPALPLWRLRSKQVLNVLDEKTLAFDSAETAKLCEKLGVPKQASECLPQAAYGRAGLIADFLRSRSFADGDPSFARLPSL